MTGISWQPIETIPTDGRTDVLLCTREMEVAVGSRDIRGTTIVRGLNPIPKGARIVFTHWAPITLPEEIQ